MGKVIMYEGYTPRQFAGNRPPVSGAAFQVRQVAQACRAVTARGLTVGQALVQYDACMVRGLREAGRTTKVSRKRSKQSRKRR